MSTQTTREGVCVYNREVDIGGAELGTIVANVLDPLVVVFETVGRDADHLDVALCKIVLATGDLAELGGADRCKVTGVREENGLQDDQRGAIGAREGRIPKNRRSTGES